MAFCKITHEIIESVEQVSGYRVHVVKDTSLQIPATVRMVRTSMPYHIVVYNPTLSEAPDYLICYECGFILRLFALPEQSRKVFIGRDEAKVSLKRQMIKELNFSKDILEQFIGRYFDGILIQLRSVPIGFRVDNWLRREYIELTDLQERFVRKELSKNNQVLSPEIKKIAPSHLYDCNVAMNAAYAKFWSIQLNDETLFLPYENIRQCKLADEMIKVCQVMPDTPENDAQIVDRWANILGLSEWYEWIPYKIDNEVKDG